MGEVLTAMMANKASGATHGMPPPQVPQLADPNSLMGSAQAQDFSQNGQSQAQPMTGGQAPPPQMAQGISMQDLSAPMPSSAPTGVDPSNPYAPLADTPKEVAESINGDETSDPITVTGDRWKPSHESTLGRITDFLFQMKGHRPIIKDRHDEADTKSAMKGFQDNPERSISRLSQVNSEGARQLYTSVAQAKADQAREAYVNLQKLKTGGNIMSGSLGAITNAPEKQRGEVYKRSLPTLRKLGAAAGYPASLLPDEYDADAINTLRASGFTGYQQEQLNKAQERIQNTELFRGKRLKQLQQGVDQTGAHQKAEEATADQRTKIEQQRADKTTQQEENVKTPYGMGTMSKDRNQLTLKDPNNPDELHVYKKVGPGNGPGGFAWKHYDILHRKPKE